MVIKQKGGKLHAMKLYLVQHGDALPKEVDPNRPLSEAGRHDVERLASFLAHGGLEFSRILHSGKARAQQTAEILALALGPDIDIAATSGIDPNDPLESFADKAKRWQENVLVVGHLPFLGRIVSHLIVGSDAAETVAFRPGSMACLERAETGNWTIAWLLQPELLA